MQHLKIALTMLLLLVLSRGKAQNLFNINTLRTIEINFYDANWDHILDSLATLNVGTGSGTQRILAEVVIDGQILDSCGVRYKGNSSMDTAAVKNPFNIDLNYVIAGQEFLGKDKIKLANCYTDPSMVREALTYELANQYMDCPRASFVKLLVNGTFIGIYTNTESIDNEFLKSFYGDSNNPFFKCDPVSFQLFGDNSNLAYHVDTLVYDTLYDMKSDYGTTELQTLCFNLENNIGIIEQYLDVDRALWFLAVSSAFVHNDGYTAFGHNYYVYKMTNGRWSIILWDVNMSFGGLLWNGSNFLPLGMSDLESQDPYLHQNAVNFRPLIAKLLSVPQYKKMYTAHYKTILAENIANDFYLQRAEFMNDLIDQDVQNEQYNAYTFAQFNDNIYNNVGVWFDLRPGLEALMVPRLAYLDTLPEFQYIQPTISNISSDPQQPLPFSTVTISAELTDETNVILGYRFNQRDIFTKVPMFDDGVHNDGLAGDGIYANQVDLSGVDVQYYIYAENANAASFSPARAQYEFYTISPQKGLVINELSAVNSSIVSDQNGEYDDWIELYNNSNSAINLTGYHLSDDQGNLSKWTFPTGANILSNDYLIIWADRDTFQTGLHANFKLASSGEQLFLTNPISEIVDMVEFPGTTDDITYGRFANGIGNFTLLYPSFNAENTTIVNTKKIEGVNFKIYPNPANGLVNIECVDTYSGILELYTLAGQLVMQEKLTDSKSYSFNVGEFKSGIYIVRIGNQHKKLVVN